MDELLCKKSLPDKFKSLDWDEYQTKLVDAFIGKRGIHRDEIENFNSYLPFILQLITEHVVVRYVDELDQLHYIFVSECHYELPYEEKHGFDDPERALLRNNYVSEIHGTVVYRILKKKTNTKTGPLPVFINHPNDPHSSSDEEEDDEMENECVSDNDDDLPESGEDEDLCEDAHLPEEKPVFYIQKFDYSEYSEIIHDVKEKHHIMDMPIFLHSKLCALSSAFVDPKLLSKPYLVPGAFIVSKLLKIIPYEEYYINNLILSQKQDHIEIRSKFYHPAKQFRTNCTLKFSLFRKPSKKGSTWNKIHRFLVEIPHEQAKFLPIIVLAIAYGWSVVDFMAAVRMFLMGDTGPEIEMYLSCIEADKEMCTTQQQALTRVSRCLSKCKTMVDPDAINSYVSFTLRGEFIPNLVETGHHVKNNYTKENIRKGYLLAECCAELIQLSELVNVKRPPHEKWKIADKRSYVYKRLDTPGEKITVLARKFIKQYTKKASSKLKNVIENRKGVDLKVILNRKIIKLTNSIKNGIFDSKNDATDSNQNKTQMLITGFCSDSLHVQTQKLTKFAMKKNSDPEPLLTHPTQIGSEGLYATPESISCGIVRNKALGGWITPMCNMVQLTKVIRMITQKHMPGFIWLDDTKLFPDHTHTVVKDLYGGILGWTKYPFKLYKLFVKYRRQGSMYSFLAMIWDRKRHIFTFNADEGRSMRPLIIMSQFTKMTQIINSSEFKCHHDPVDILLHAGCVEYLDAAEEYCGVVFTAADFDDFVKCGREHTHMEIHGSFALSLTVSKAFANHNQGPRRLYTGNLEKRSMSMKLFEDRGTNVSYSLWYGQVPLLSEPIDKSLHLRQNEPTGINCVVSILSMAENMEDAYLLKKECVERGMCVSSETNVITVTLGSSYVFQKPRSMCKGKASVDKYRHIASDGFPKLNAKVKGGDCVVGKVFLKKNHSESEKRCASRFLPHDCEYTICNVVYYPDKPNCRTVRVSMVKSNKPQVGDKFFMAHGQKGTISRVVHSHDLPWVCTGPMQGVSPDLVINTAALSRNAQGLLLEIMLSKARALRPEAIDQYNNIFMSKACFEDKLRACTHILNSSGFRYDSKERMRLGTTGDLIASPVYTGMAYIHVLKHLAKDKLRARTSGPINELTRQTSTGKKQSGGQRNGEMESKYLYQTQILLFALHFTNLCYCWFGFQIGTKTHMEPVQYSKMLIVTMQTHSYYFIVHTVKCRPLEI